MSFRFGAVILAAGYSSRMHSFKALLPLGEETAIERVLRIAGEAGAAERIVVTGFERERLEPYIEEAGVKEAYNENFDAGMFSSIQTGAAKADKSLDGFFLMPVDCPLPEKDILIKTAKAAEENPGCFVVPCCLGKKGHPLFVPGNTIDEILASEGKRGLKDVVDKHSDDMVRIEADSESVVMDMDTEKDYHRILAYIRSGGGGKKFHELADGRRFILVRHGEIEQHKEKIFLGVTNVPLSEKGRAQARRAGFQVEETAPKTDRIYSSDLKRASETAEIIKRICNLKDVVYSAGLKEMNLGAWDGKPISLVKEKYPEEYEKRGKDIFGYKFDHNCESFFDMQYRVITELKKYLLDDVHKDIIIVSHKGVLRVIDNFLKGKRVDDPWEPMEVGEVRVICSQ